MDTTLNMFAKLRNRTGIWVERSITILLAGGTAALLVLLLALQLPNNTQYQLEAGQVSPANIVAPRQITYESQILTEEARERAATAVELQYDPPESRVRRQQVERAEAILEFVSIVRNDPYASRDVQADYLSAIPDLNLSQENIDQIIDISPDEWDQLLFEVPQALTSAMREEIHNTESALKAARRSVPAFIDSELSEAATTIVSKLVRDLIRPNSFLNEERTEEMRTAERNKVPIQMVTVERDEVILRAGDVVTPKDVEALTAIGLLQTEWNWWFALRAFSLVVVILGVVGGALYRLHPQALASNRQLALLSLATLLWLVLGKLMITPHEWMPYLYPMATLGMLIAVLIDLRIAVVITLAFTIMVLYLSNANAFLVSYVSVGSLVGALTLGRAERLTAFLWAGLAVMLSNLLLFASFRAPFVEFTTAKQMQMLLVIALNGGLSASIALIGYFIFGNIFGVTTSLQLTELSRPTHPLLRQLLLKSPGTYHHTIVVSNLSERAAAAIGADAFLTRVGAYYHDIGKTVRPYFFIENSAEGAENPHNKLDPLTSAQIIISHVTDGVDLAHKYKLPARLQDFIREHHGTSLVQYFYSQAQKEAKEGEVVREADFRYAGPRPRSKETAILMLADMCESAVRAIRPASRADLANVVNGLIDSRVADGELDQCDLTFKELQTVKEVFLQVLQGVHHPRINYPKQVKQPQEWPEPQAMPAAEKQSVSPRTTAGNPITGTGRNGGGIPARKAPPSAGTETKRTETKRTETQRIETHQLEKHRNGSDSPKRPPRLPGGFEQFA